MGTYEEAKKKAKAAAAKGKSSNANAHKEEATDDELEDSEDEDILGPAAASTRVFAITSRSKTQPVHTDVAPPPAPDPTWTRPTRTESELALDRMLNTTCKIAGLVAAATDK